MELFDYVVSYAFPVLNLVCAVTLMIRFRGSPGALLGGIAFGIWFANNIAQVVLPVLAHDFFWDHTGLLSRVSLIGSVCLVAALLTGQTRGPVLGRPSMSFSQFYLSFEGRISRSAYWLKFVLPILVILVIANTADILAETNGTISIVASAIIVWPNLAIMAKRWHDRNKSALWILIGLIPIVGTIWALVELGFLKGTDGENQFGTDPVESGQLSLQS